MLKAHELYKMMCGVLWLLLPGLGRSCGGEAGEAEHEEAGGGSGADHEAHHAVVGAQDGGVDDARPIHAPERGPAHEAGHLGVVLHPQEGLGLLGSGGLLSLRQGVQRRKLLVHLERLHSQPRITDAVLIRCCVNDGQRCWFEIFAITHRCLIFTEQEKK